MPIGKPIPGPWRTDRVPWTRAPLRALADPNVDVVVVVTPSQAGKTSLAENVIGWKLDVRPQPVLAVFASEAQARSFARDRLAPLVDDTPQLRAGLDSRRAFVGTKERWVNGVRVGVAWQSSPSELAMHPAALAIGDEIDRWDEDSGGEGDPISLMFARLKNYPNSKALLISSPTTASGPIVQWWQEGSRSAWSWQCRDCGAWFFPLWRHVSLPTDATPEIARAQAVVACPECGAAIRDADRAEMNARGAYRCHALEDDGSLVPSTPPEGSRVRSYWVSGVANPLYSLGRLAEDTVRAYRSREPGRIQATTNTVLGEHYRTEGARPEWTRVLDCRASYDVDPLPAGVVFLTAGIDPGREDLYYVIRGWGFNAESWGVGYGQLYGSTSHDGVWLQAQRIMSTPIGGLPIRRVFVDSGFKPGASRAENVIYAFCRRCVPAAPTKGHAHQPTPIRMAQLEPHRRKIAGPKTALYHLDSDHWKSFVYARLDWTDGAPGAWHEPASIGEEYARQLTNEEVVDLPSGRRLWRRTGTRRNHYLDAASLAAAAAHLEGVQSLRPNEIAQAPRPSIRVELPDTFAPRSL